MITVRHAAERGRTRLEWLDSRHTFSFGDYADPRHDEYRALRVLNEDWVRPGAGFGMHPHRDMEIVTYVIAGALEHKDSLGTGSVIRPGEVQRMSAGTGIRHSEFNPSTQEPVHLLQIWIRPERAGLRPEYEQRAYPAAERRGRWRTVAARDGRDGALTIHADAAISACLLEPSERIPVAVSAGRGAWLQVVRGRVTLGTADLREGDGASIEGEAALELLVAESAELLLLDLA